MSQDLQSPEATCREIGTVIGQAIEDRYGKQRVGFALLLFDFGKGGHLTYILNAEREDMVKALYECASTLLKGEDQPHFASGKRQLKG